MKPWTPPLTLLSLLTRPNPPLPSSPSNAKTLTLVFPPILADDGGGGDEEDTVDRGQPPFKFHRIWTEPDEIRFLRGLLDCTYDGLVFPRDLGVFYDRFSGTMSQPYTKSQLSEKLRRLRKKFRVVSSRIARGLDKVLLSPHDLALFELSEQLWHPNFSDSSPFGGGIKPKKSNLVGVKVSFSPTLPSSNQLVVGKTVMDVFDQCLKEVRMGLVSEGRQGSAQAGSSKEVKADDFEARWREQRIAELDVLAHRLRVLEGKLVIEMRGCGDGDGDGKKLQVEEIRQWQCQKVASYLIWIDGITGMGI
ncbi:hypothetical protein Acr_00g0063460 [Actinidia rufa]|uniref:Glabrous enhancer-binding protein-like DBD domain-containing protein n=1 Tax=Actinidia rufa TaxID=165716 RepID=A0A7J0DPG8_9ERIC|nr:hypothetical protein Acr_00g0063460 [Actinidia rufa]